MDFIYYKQICGNTSIIFFYINQITRNIEGVIAETRTDRIRSISFVQDTSCWEDIDNNRYAIDMIDRSIPISKEEYDKVYEIACAMIKSDFWFLSDDKMIIPNEKKIVAETVIC